MTRFLLILISITLVSACATRERYEARIDTYVGKSINVVMDDWGYPRPEFLPAAAMVDFLLGSALVATR